jgi:hypothetical protein
MLARTLTRRCHQVFLVKRLFDGSGKRANSQRFGTPAWGV